MKLNKWISLLSACLLTPLAAFGADRIPTLIIDGQNRYNHDWKGTTPIIKKAMEDSGLFAVTVATTPPLNSGKIADFKPDFKTYRLVLLNNYDGESWSAETKAAFEKFVSEGGGFVPIHAADNAFPEWKEFNLMTGVGGWQGRNIKSGPYLRLRDGKFVQDATTPGPGGSHGAQHEYVVETQNPEHPIMAGLPAKWKHVKDELYDRMRGPAQNVTVLASSFSDPKTNGSGEVEPILMTLTYGKGRIFHDVMGHGQQQMKCVGFLTTLLRGSEWAATGKVTQKVPDNFPTEEKTASLP